MNPKATLALLLMLIGLGTYAYFVEHQGQVEMEASEKADKLLIKNFASDKVDLIELNRDGQRIEMKLADNPEYTAAPEGEKATDAEGRELLDTGPTRIWQITSPVTDEANGGTINSLKNALITAEIDKTVSDQPGVDLSPYGLAPPVAEVTLSAEGDRRKILLGRKSPVGGKYYIKLDDAPEVYQVTNSMISANLTKPLQDLREKRVINYLMVTDIIRYTMRVGNDKFVFARDPENSDLWNIVSPIARPGDKTKVENLLREFSTLSAATFVDENAEDLGKYGLDEPKVVVAMELAQGRGVKTIIIGGKTDDGKYYAGRPGRTKVVAVDKKIGDKLEVDLDDLTSKIMFSVASENIEKLRVEWKGAEPYEMVGSQGASYNINGDDNKKVQDSDVRRIINRFKGLRAAGVLDYSDAAFQKYGLQEPQLKITLLDAAGKELATTLVGNALPDRDDEYVLSNGKKVVLYTMNKSFLDLLPRPEKLDDIIEKPASPVVGDEAPDPSRDDDGLAIPEEDE